MKKLKAYTIAAAGLVVLVLVLVLTGSGRAVAQAFNQVKVINAHSEAVPVCNVCEPLPFQQNVGINIPGGATEVSVPLITVPPGKRLLLKRGSGIVEPLSRRFEPMLLEVVVDGVPQSFHAITVDERTKKTLVDLVFGETVEGGRPVEFRILPNGRSDELSPVKLNFTVQIVLQPTVSAP